MNTKSNSGVNPEFKEESEGDFRLNVQGKHFYFVRHAETEWNALQLCQGLKDIELNDKGRKTSLEFARKLSKIPIECICSSPLKRAYQTAETISQFQPDAQFNFIDELKERDWGELEGISSKKMYEIEENEESDPNYIPGFGIEDRFELKKRIVQGLNKSFLLHPFRDCPFFCVNGFDHVFNPNLSP